MSFIQELKRRNVFKVGIAYLVGSWLLIQVADILLDNIGAPAWVLQTLFVVLGMGFFVAVFFAWAFELTPEGVKREKDVAQSESITPHTAKKLNNTILALMAIAIAYLLFDNFSSINLINCFSIKRGFSPHREWETRNKFFKSYLFAFSNNLDPYVDANEGLGAELSASVHLAISLQIANCYKC